jgi:hypothetical protein
LRARSQVRDMLDASWGINGGFTSHVFLTLEYNESISAVGLLLLVWLLMSVGISYDSNLEERG